MIMKHIEVRLLVGKCFGVKETLSKLNVKVPTLSEVYKG